jgi:hypothetical protein
MLQNGLSSAMAQVESPFLDAVPKDSITAGENRAILVQVQFSDGLRLPMSRSELDSILSDKSVVVVEYQDEKAVRTDVGPSQRQTATADIDEDLQRSAVRWNDRRTPLKAKFAVSPFHTAVVYFMAHRLKKTTDSSKFVTYKNLTQAFENYSSTSIGGASMWFREYVTRMFRLTYVKVDGGRREMVLFGGVQKGLMLVVGD